MNVTQRKQQVASKPVTPTPAPKSSTTLLDLCLKSVRVIAAVLFILVATPLIYIVLPFRIFNAPLRKLGVPTTRLPADLAIILWGRGLFAILGGKAKVEGVKNVPVTAPTIFMYSHGSYFDPIVLCSYCPISAKFIFKKELIYMVPFVFLAAWGAGYIPINRKAKDSAISALYNTAKYIKATKRSVAIAPEGTRTLDGKLQPFKKGPFHLAIDSGVEHVVPVVLFNNFHLWPSGMWFPDSGTIRLKFAPPIKVNANETVESLSAAVRQSMEAEISNYKEPVQVRKENNIWPAVLFLTLMGIVSYLIINLFFI